MFKNLICKICIRFGNIGIGQNCWGTQYETEIPSELLK